jgi:hypothetical protein
MINHRDSTINNYSQLQQIQDQQLTIVTVITYATKYIFFTMGIVLLTSIVNTTYGRLCSFNMNNIFYSLAMSGSPICKTLSKTSYTLNFFVDTLFLGILTS